MVVFTRPRPAFTKVRPSDTGLCLQPQVLGRGPVNTFRSQSAGPERCESGDTGPEVLRSFKMGNLALEREEDLKDVHVTCGRLYT